MFVQYLNERQQAALLHYSSEIMHADNVVEADEKAYLDVLRSQSQPGVEAEEVPVDELPDLSTTAQVALLCSSNWLEWGSQTKSSPPENRHSSAISPPPWRLGTGS